MAKFFKKITALILCLVCVLSFTACESEVDNYNGPWWTQMGGNANRTGTLDSDGTVLPDINELPDMAWTMQLDTFGSKIASTMLYVDGYIYFGCSDGYVYCYKDGKKRARQEWKFLTDGSITAGLVYDNGIIYASCVDGCVYALSADKGELLWFNDIGGTDVDAMISTTPVFVNDTLIVATDLGKVFALSTKEGSEGKVLWTYTVNGDFYLNTAIAYCETPEVDGGVVCFGSNDTYYYALNATTGKLLWSMYTKTYFAETPTGYNGNFYIPSGEGILYCVNAATGKINWKFNTDHNLYISGPVAAKDGKVVFGAYDSKVYCLDAENGNKVWEYEATYTVTSSPVLINNYVLVGIAHIDGSTHYLYCLDFNSGAFKWISKSNNTIAVSPMVINGSIFFANEGGLVVKLSGAQETTDSED